MNRRYGELAAAVVRQAIKDWKDNNDVLNFRPDDEDAWRRTEEIERFFRSRWYRTLRELAPDVIPQNMIGKLKEVSGI